MKLKLMMLLFRNANIAQRKLRYCNLNLIKSILQVMLYDICVGFIENIQYHPRGTRVLAI